LIDLSSLIKVAASKRIVEPIELFQSLSVQDKAVNDLWLAQGDALRKWHENRHKSDVTIALNTGAGKTLVGLLVAQSLVNETRKGVVYACSSIQLVEQTAAKAKGYGLPVTTYFKGEYSNNLFHSCEASLITVYQALFNGKSVFAGEDLAAIVFDDAHTAQHIIQDQFTLSITRKDMPDTYKEIAAMFRPYFESIGNGVSYRESLKNGEGNVSWLVPPFEVHRNLSSLQQSLLNAGLDERLSTMFVWPHIRDHIEHCGLIVTGSQISFAPPFIPTLGLSYFSKAIRRVYLSATLPLMDNFIRTFGKAPDLEIKPDTKAGECERMILVPQLSSSIPGEHIEDVKDIIANQKTLIVTTTYRRAALWESVANISREDNVTERLEIFKNAEGPAKLLLASRFDGIDLPGDTCRVMTIDDLPARTNLLERYLWHELGLVRTLRSTIASRIAQSFGRISRGMSDHGVVLLTGTDLINWLLRPENRAALPAFLRSQLELGFSLSKSIQMSDFRQLITQCLSRESTWLALYEQGMKSQEPDPGRSELEQEMERLAGVEVRFGRLIWEREYLKAAKLLDNEIDKAFDVSIGYGAWLALWLGFAHQLSGDIHKATVCYKRAHGASRNIPAFVGPGVIAIPDGASKQVVEAARNLSNANITDVLRRFDSRTGPISGGTPAQVEEALRSLGEYLGLDASRPDHEFDTGPDVLWIGPDGSCLCMEVKSDKQATSVYRKEELGELRDHVRWVRDNHKCQEIVMCFVGPIVPASDSANPDPEMLLTEPSKFGALVARLRSALVDVSANAGPAQMISQTQQVFEERSLMWPKLIDTLDLRHLKSVTQ